MPALVSNVDPPTSYQAIPVKETTLDALWTFHNHDVELAYNRWQMLMANAQEQSIARPMKWEFVWLVRWVLHFRMVAAWPLLITVWLPIPLTVSARPANKDTSWSGTDAWREIDWLSIAGCMAPMEDAWLASRDSKVKMERVYWETVWSREITCLLSNKLQQWEVKIKEM